MYVPASAAVGSEAFQTTFVYSASDAMPVPPVMSATVSFAFSADESSSYLPHAHTTDCFCYIGTHDNDTVLGWRETEPEANLKKAAAYLGLNEEEGFVRGMLRG